MSNPTENTIKFLVVGCSETPEYRDIGLVEIDRMDRQAGKFSCGWHRVIRRDGTVENGRHNWQVGSHTRGHDKYSIGICLVGGGDPDIHDVDLYTEEQLDALAEEVTYLLEEYPDAHVVGQRDLLGGHSPHFNVRQTLGYGDYDDNYDY